MVLYSNFTVFVKYSIKKNGKIPGFYLLGKSVKNDREILSNYFLLIQCIASYSSWLWWQQNACFDLNWRLISVVVFCCFRVKSFTASLLCNVMADDLPVANTFIQKIKLLPSKSALRGMMKPSKTIIKGIVQVKMLILSPLVVPKQV